MDANIRRGMSIVEACEYLGGISRSTLFHLLKEGLPSYTIGSRRFFTKDSLDKFIDKRLKALYSGNGARYNLVNKKA